MQVVITGTPGVGKHSIAGLLADKTGLAVIDINRVAAESGIVGPGGEVDADELAGIMAGRLAPDCIVVGHLAPYVLEPENAWPVIVLRRNPYGLMATYAERGYSEAKCRENAASEILGVTYYDALERFGDGIFQVIATDASQTMQKVTGILSGHGRSEEADWLGKVLDNDDIWRFFLIE